MQSITSAGAEAPWPSPMHTASPQSASTEDPITTDDDETTTTTINFTGYSPNTQEQPKYNKKKKKANNTLTTSRFKRKRKSTNTRRKEEKEVLARQLEALQAQLQTLQCQAMVAQTQGTDQGMTGLALQTTVREAIQQQQLVLANLQGLFSGYVKQLLVRVNPIQSFICLGKDPLERRNTLYALRPHKLQQAKHFINRRRISIDSSTTSAEEQRFETKDGRSCLLSFCVTPLRGAKSVKWVFDQVMFRAFNFEIILSERVGNLTIREDDDSNVDAATSHHKLVSTSVRGVQIELNTVIFSEFHEATETQSAYGIIVGDSVDEDELYPYKPLERVRMDITWVILVTLSAVDGEQNGTSHVVMTRWRLSTLHRADFELPMPVVQELRDDHYRFMYEMNKSFSELCDKDSGHMESAQKLSST